MNIEFEDITYSQLKFLLNIYDDIGFNQYLKDIFKYLSAYYKCTNCSGLKQNDMKPQKGEIAQKDNKIEGLISKNSFLKFLNLPIFISEKVYLSIMQKSEYNELSDYISFDLFSSFFNTLYFGDYETIARLLFNIIDSDNNGLITLKEIRDILVVIPISCKLRKTENTIKKEKESGIDKIILSHTKNQKLQDFQENHLKFILQFETYLASDLHSRININKISYDDFLSIIESKCDIFIQLLSLLYINISITSDFLWFYNQSSQENMNKSLVFLTRMKSIDLLNSNGSGNNFSNAKLKSLMFPNIKCSEYELCFSPFESLLESLNNKTNKERLKLLQRKKECIMENYPQTNNCNCVLLQKFNTINCLHETQNNKENKPINEPKFIDVNQVKIDYNVDDAYVITKSPLEKANNPNNPNNNIEVLPKDVKFTISNVCLKCKIKNNDDLPKQYAKLNKKRTKSTICSSSISTKFLSKFLSNYL